jgi:hypothetical protein
LDRRRNVGPVALYAAVVAAVGWSEAALNQLEGGRDHWDDAAFSVGLGAIPAAVAALAGWFIPPKPRKAVDVLLFADMFGLIAAVPVVMLLAAALVM